MTHDVMFSELTYTHPPSNKFWRYYILNNNYFVTEWGKIGSSGSNKLHTCRNLDRIDAYNMAHDLAGSKINKGYRIQIAECVLKIPDYVVESCFNGSKLGLQKLQKYIYGMMTVLPKSVIISQLDSILERN